MTKHAGQFPPPPADPIEYEHWLDGIAPLQEVTTLRGGCTPEALIRLHHQGAITLIRRTKRLWGMRRRDALALPKRAASQPRSEPVSAHDVVEGLIRDGHLIRLPGGLIVETTKLGTG
jgi:hypothetical protein